MSKQTQTFDASPAPASRRQWWAFAAVAIASFILAGWLVSIEARNRAVTSLGEQAAADANLNAALVLAVLEKQRALPLALSRDGEMEAALTHPERTALDPLNRKLEKLAEGTQAAVIYLIGLDGVAIAASNWREPTSFVGANYEFRPYFRDALQQGYGEHFALGTVSHRPGFYISRRIDNEDGPIGVIAVKLEFDRIEQAWGKAGRLIFVVDEHDVVLITSLPSWRFMTIGRLPEEQREAIHDSMQFGDASLPPLPISFRPAAGDGVMLAQVLLPGAARKSEYLAIGSAVPSTPWKMYSLEPTAPRIPAAMRDALFVTFAVMAAITALGAFLLARRQKIARRIADARHTRIELERRVEERTRDLVELRDRLQAEIAGHRSTEILLQGVQEDLVHANRLAIMGQVAAGVAHEINQPVATIRAYADNACVFLERRQIDAARENLTEIAALTERIGVITDDLKALAKRGRTPSEPVALGKVISGALILLRSRFLDRLDRLDIDMLPPELKVYGYSIRLEQVFINLLQNALEAVEARGSEGRIELRIVEEDADVVITVSDNGPGMSEHIRDKLFTPFHTSKEKGLGLGLVIVKEILTDYGGGISADTGPDGTIFRVRLKKA